MSPALRTAAHGGALPSCRHFFVGGEETIGLVAQLVLQRPVYSHPRCDRRLVESWRLRRTCSPCRRTSSSSTGWSGHRTSRRGVRGGAQSGRCRGRHLGARAVHRREVVTFVMNVSGEEGEEARRAAGLCEKALPGRLVAHEVAAGPRRCCEGVGDELVPHGVPATSHRGEGSQMEYLPRGIEERGPMGCTQSVDHSACGAGPRRRARQGCPH